MLLCRVLLGDFHVALHYDSAKYKGSDPRSPVRRPPPKTADGIELYDSVLGESKANGGDTLNYREWVVYDRYIFVIDFELKVEPQVSSVSRVHYLLQSDRRHWLRSAA
jgi:hypothetical protein